MKRIAAFLISLVMLMSCGGKLATPNDSEQKLIDLLTLWWLSKPRPIIMTTLDLDKVGNVVTTKNGTTVVKSSSMMSAVNSDVIAPKMASTSPTSDVIYITGLKGTTSMMLELTLDLSTPGTSKSVRTVLFQEQVMNPETGAMETQLLNRPFSAYPSAFTIGGVKYLLFSRIGYGEITKFKLMKYVSEDSSSITYVESNEWDFSVLENDIKARNTAAINAMNADPARSALTPLETTYGVVWVAAPDFNPVTNTMYFGYKLARHLTGNADEDSAPHSLLYMSKLVGNQFQVPQQITGEANPYDGMHYGDTTNKSIDDFINYNAARSPYGYSNVYNNDDQGGYARFGRIYTVKTGATATSVKAYFTDLFASFPTANVTSDAASSPFTVNSEILATETRWGTLGTGGYDQDTIATFQMNDIYEVTIDGDTGISTGLAKTNVLADPEDATGMNYISNLSEDGTLMYVSHCDNYVDEETGKVVFRKSTAIALTQVDSYSIPAWNGQVIVYQNVSGVWNRVAKITKQDVTVE